MAKRVVAERGVSIRLACLIFSVSETCYRYEAKKNVENDQIADWLLRLTDNHRNWGFGLCYLYLRNVKGFKWNHKRIYRIYKALGSTCGSSPGKGSTGRSPSHWQYRRRSIKSGQWTLCMISCLTAGPSGYSM
jgi:putative transposase